MNSYNSIIVLQSNPIDYIIKGSDKINRFLNLKDGSTPSQLWVASVLEESLPGSKNGLSLTLDGSTTLKDLIASSPLEYLGADHYNKYGCTTALLLKLLSSKDRLLVQTHPNDEQAKRFFNLDCGKSEAWYVLDADQDAKVYIGFKEHITKDYFRKLIEKQDTSAILDCLHCFNLHKDDIIYVSPNTVHAMGNGSLVAEIQQPCPITIRAERIQPDGTVLDEYALHSGIGLNNALNCFNFNGLPREDTYKKYFSCKSIVNSHEERIFPFVCDSYFSMRKLTIKGD